jgi:hypothetical protein
MQLHFPAVHVPDEQSDPELQEPPTAATHGEPVSPAQQGVALGTDPTPVHAQTPPLQADPAQHEPFAQLEPSGLHAPVAHTPPLQAPLQQLAFTWQSAPT